MALSARGKSQMKASAITAFLMLSIFWIYQMHVESTRETAITRDYPINNSKNESPIGDLQNHLSISTVTSAPIRAKPPVSVTRSRLKYLQPGIDPVCKDGEIDHGCYCRKAINVYPPKYELLSKDIRKKRGCKKRRPDAIIPGAMKSGTTALKAYLEIHPAIIMPERELHFANHQHSTEELNEYKNVMPFSTPDQVAIEKTPGYYIRIPVVKRIREAMPDTKFIFILREPIQRAMSNYMHMLAVNISRPGPKGLTVKEHSSAPQYDIKSTFGDSVLFPNGSLKTANRLLDSSRYVTYLKQWYDIFPPKQILVLDGDELTEDPVPGLRKVEDFLGIDHFFDEENFYFNETKGFICLRDPFEMCMKSSKGRPHDAISADVLEKLQKHFRPYNRRLVKLLGRELSWTNAY